LGPKKTDEELHEWMQRALAADVLPPKAFQDIWKLNATEKKIGTLRFEAVALQRFFEDGHVFHNLDDDSASAGKVGLPKRTTIEDVQRASFKEWPTHGGEDLATWTEAEKVKSLVHTMFGLASNMNIKPVLDCIPWKKPSVDFLMFNLTNLRVRFCNGETLNAQHKWTWTNFLESYKSGMNLCRVKEHNNMFLTLREKMGSLRSFLGLCTWRDSLDKNTPCLPAPKHGAVFKTDWADVENFKRHCKRMFMGIMPRGKAKCEVHSLVKAIKHWFEHEPPMVLTGLTLVQPKSKKKRSFWRLELSDLVSLAALMKTAENKDRLYSFGSSVERVFNIPADLMAIRNRTLDNAIFRGATPP
jgi:hypothetical protein